MLSVTTSGIFLYVFYKTYEAYSSLLQVFSQQNHSLAHYLVPIENIPLPRSKSEFQCTGVNITPPERREQIKSMSNKSFRLIYGNLMLELYGLRRLIDISIKKILDCKQLQTQKETLGDKLKKVRCELHVMNDWVFEMDVCFEGVLATVQEMKTDRDLSKRQLYEALFATDLLSWFNLF